MKIEQIDTRRMGYGVGVLRGVLSRSDIDLASRDEVEAAIVHIRSAARAIERLQQTVGKPLPRRRSSR